MASLGKCRPTPVDPAVRNAKSSMIELAGDMMGYADILDGMSSSITGCIRMMSCLSHPTPRARSFLDSHVVSFVQWPHGDLFC